MQLICIAEKYIYPDSNQFRDAPRIFVFDDAIFIINFMEHHSKQRYLSRVARLSVIYRDSDIIIKTQITQGFSIIYLYHCKIFCYSSKVRYIFLL